MRMTHDGCRKIYKAFCIAAFAAMFGPGLQGAAFAGGYYGGYGHHYGYSHHYGGYGHGYGYGHHYNGGYGHYNYDVYPYYSYGPGIFFGHILSSRRHNYSSYREAPLSGETIVVQPEPAQKTARNNCMQTREYQAKIIIGGKTVDAYGTACLQPDGSWRRGPLTPEPDY